MCTAEATFFYGVFVKLAYLCFASDSYKANKKSLCAIDLICSRRKKGQLSIQGSATSILSVPQEVWEMVKMEMIDIGMREAEQRMLEKYFGGNEDGYVAPSSWLALESGKHDLDGFMHDRGAREMLKTRESAIENILASFGLALPFDSPYSKEEYPQDDPLALSAISLPLRKTGNPAAPQSFPTAIASPPTDISSSHEVVQFTKDSLKLPSDADRRIKRFLSFFRLESVNPSSTAIYRPHLRKQNHSKSSSSSNQEKNSKPRKATHESRCCDQSETEPHWHLWISSEYSW